MAEHTDYGLLTMLAQDEVGGLEVCTKTGWVDVEPVPGSFVCNIGDMLELATGGLYRSTPHRVRIPTRDRISMPFFLDPGWDETVTTIHTLNGGRIVKDRAADPTRWDGRSVFTHTGTYGEYLTEKVSKVFPHLFGRNSDRDSGE